MEWYHPDQIQENGWEQQLGETWKRILYINSTNSIRDSYVTMEILWSLLGMIIQLRREQLRLLQEDDRLGEAVDALYGHAIHGRFDLAKLEEELRGTTTRLNVLAAEASRRAAREVAEALSEGASVEDVLAQMEADVAPSAVGSSPPVQQEAERGGA